MIFLDAEFEKDVKWWLAFMPKWNGSASFIDPAWNRPDHFYLFNDVFCYTWIWRLSQGQWLRGDWPPWVLANKPAIEYLETIPILLALKVCGKVLRKKRIIFHCDNNGAVQAWSAQNSSSPTVLDLMRKIVAAAAENNFVFSIKYIYGLDNSVADALSRSQMERFKRLAPEAKLEPEKVPNIFQNSRNRSSHTAHSFSEYR